MSGEINWVIKVDDVEYDLSQLGREELLALKVRVDETTARIKGQIDEAKLVYQTTGERADVQWLRNAEAARQINGRHSQRIQLMLRKQKEEYQDRRMAGREKSFMDAARIVLDETKFFEVLDKARALQPEVWK